MRQKSVRNYQGLLCVVNKKILLNGFRISVWDDKKLGERMLVMVAKIGNALKVTEL